MIVLDCNAAISMAQLDDNGKALLWLRDTGERAIAPDLIQPEIAHVLSKYVRGNYCCAEEAAKLGMIALGCVDNIIPTSSLWVEAMAEAARLKHSAYDMLYFVLARRTASTLFTLDRKLQQVCLDNGVNCVCAMDLPPVAEGE